MTTYKLKTVFEALSLDNVLIIDNGLSRTIHTVFDFVVSKRYKKLKYEKCHVKKCKQKEGVFVIYL